MCFFFVKNFFQIFILVPTRCVGKGKIFGRKRAQNEEERALKSQDKQPKKSLKKNFFQTKIFLFQSLIFTFPLKDFLTNLSPLLKNPNKQTNIL